MAAWAGFTGFAGTDCIFCGADGCHLPKREAVVSGEALGLLQHEGQFEFFLAAGILSAGRFGLCGRA